MLSREVADLVKYLIIIYLRGWYVRSSLGCCSGHLRVTVVVYRSIRMMVVMMMMVVGNRVCRIAGHAYWRAILSVLAVMMMAASVSWFRWMITSKTH